MLGGTLVLKTSLIYSFLQIANIVISLYLLVYIAQNVDPKTLSILAIYSIINTIYMFFTFLGYETVLIRNLLHWEKIGNISKIKSLVTNAFISRFITSLILMIPTYFYVIYLSENKYNGEYFETLILFLISGMFSGVNNSNSLILKAMDRFIISFLVMTFVSIFGKCVALYYFNESGFNVFIQILVITPVVSFLISSYFVKKYIDLRFFKIKYLLSFTKNKYFIYSSYINYFKVGIDQLLVSIVFPTEILSAYTLAKRVEEIGGTLIKSFFEPILQKLIALKNNVTQINSYMKNVNLIKKVSVLIISVFCTSFLFYVEDLILMLKLEHYENLEIYIMCSLMTIPLYMISKVELHILNLFSSQKLLFKIDIIWCFLVFLSSFAFLFFVQSSFLMLSRVVVAVGVILISYYCFSKYKYSIFNN